MGARVEPPLDSDNLPDFFPGFIGLEDGLPPRLGRAFDLEPAGLAMFFPARGLAADLGAADFGTEGLAVRAGFPRVSAGVFLRRGVD